MALRALTESHIEGLWQERYLHIGGAGWRRRLQPKASWNAGSSSETFWNLKQLTPGAGEQK